MQKTALLLAVLATPTLAQDFTTTIDVTKMPIDYVYHLVVTNPTMDGSALGPFVQTFRMEDGACLRGPLVFTGTDGKEQFRLVAGVEYPAGCGAKREH